MFTLTLLDGGSPPRVIEKLVARDGLLRIGRDPASDWIIEDPERFISRNHVELTILNSTLMLRALGMNGVYLDNPPRKVPKDTEISVRPGDCFSIGPYRILIEPADLDAGAADKPLEQDCVSGGPRASSLLDAFCEGAEIDPSQFIAQEAEELMREAGAVYRQAIFGLSGLLRDRNTLRSQIVSDRTTIGGAQNNLLKWAPAHRVLVDVLTNKEVGFVAGAEAVKLSFLDLRSHLRGVMAGHRSALLALLETLRPSDIEASVPRKLLRDHAAKAWASFASLHAELEREVENELDGKAKDSFARGYEEGTRESVAPGASEHVSAPLQVLDRGATLLRHHRRP